MFLTCLQIGDIISPSAEVVERASSLKTENLYYGHLCQWAHDEALRNAGVDFELNPNRYSPWDRMIDGVWHDDKLALYGRNGVSSTHTIGSSELEPWSLQAEIGNEVIIHSFTQIREIGSTRFQYLGALGFSKLPEFIQPSQFNNTFYFKRNIAYQRALLQQL
jgi:hypothetical protein